MAKFPIEDSAVKSGGTEAMLEYIYEKRKPVWDAACTYCESDFLAAVQRFFHLSIEEALNDDDYIVKILAIWTEEPGKGH